MARSQPRGGEIDGRAGLADESICTSAAHRFNLPRSHSVCEVNKGRIMELGLSHHVAPLWCCGPGELRRWESCRERASSCADGAACDCSGGRPGKSVCDVDTHAFVMCRCERRRRARRRMSMPAAIDRAPAPLVAAEAKAHADAGKPAADGGKTSAADGGRTARGRSAQAARDDGRCCGEARPAHGKARGPKTTEGAVATAPAVRPLRRRADSRG